MQKNFAATDPTLPGYLDSLLYPEDPTLSETRRYSEAQGLPAIQVGAFDARHLEVIASSISANTPRMKAVEIGTLGGYSGIALTRGMLKTAPAPHEVMLYSFDMDPKHLRVASENFKHAGLLKNVKFFEGPAVAQLKKIENQGPFDLVFIDADKVNYPNYLDWAEKNLRAGGILLADNVFAWGYLNAKTFPDEDTKLAVQALRLFNEKLAHHKGFFTTFMPTGEGLAMAVRLSH